MSNTTNLPFVCNSCGAGYKSQYVGMCKKNGVCNGTIVPNPQAEPCSWCDGAGCDVCKVPSPDQALEARTQAAVAEVAQVRAMLEVAMRVLADELEFFGSVTISPTIITQKVPGGFRCALPNDDGSVHSSAKAAVVAALREATKS